KPEAKKALPKPQVDTIESLRKEFTRQLEGLRNPLTKAKELIESDPYKPIMEGLSTPQNVATASGAFDKLPQLVQALITEPLARKYIELSKLVPRITRVKGQATIRADWEKHRKEHKEVYDCFTQLNKLREQKDPKGQKSPWLEIAGFHALVSKLEKLFQAKK